MKLLEYFKNEKCGYCEFWTLLERRMSCLASTNPPRAYYVKETSQLNALMSTLMSNTTLPKVSMDQAAMLKNSDINDLMSRTRGVMCAVILNKRYDGIKEIILSAGCDPDPKNGLTPVFRVQWNNGSKKFVTERVDAKAYINHLSGSSKPNPATSRRSERFDRLALFAPYFGFILLCLLGIGPWLLHQFGGFVAARPEIWYSNLIIWYIAETLAVIALAIMLDVI